MKPSQQLLGPNGRPISSADFQNKKASPPKLGEAFGAWAGRDVQYASLPGGGVVQFDLSRLELGDYRAMRDHYQINSSLAVLTFMQHQSDWHIECESSKIADACTEQLTNIWTPLCRSLGTANWAGYSPNALNWENDIQKRATVIDKVKDLIPEECRVNWKLVNGYAPPGELPPKFKIYDGIKQGLTGMWWDDNGTLLRNNNRPIPVDNTFWYPLLMENGDYYGRKLLRPAFTSWFFSVLMHLFANRYYERFGEPTPIGRAPFDEEFPETGSALDGQFGNVAMLEILKNLRNRGVVVLPNSRSATGVGDATDWDYQIEYLESQMRGADFERYMTRLDEEMSIGLFTPILLLRTADVGSYNLGVGHMQMYLWMLNAMNGDRKQYIDKYILRKFVNFNFGLNAPDAKIIYKKLGNQNMDLVQAMLTSMISKGTVKPDLEQLGEMAGLTLTEVKVLTSDPTSPDSTSPDPGSANPNPDQSPSQPGAKARIPNEARATIKDIISRVSPQISNAFRDGNFGPDLSVSMGYKRKMEKALEADGFGNSIQLANELYGKMDNWITDVIGLGTDEISSPDSFMGMFEKVLELEVDSLAHA